MGLLNYFLNRHTSAIVVVFIISAIFSFPVKAARIDDVKNRGELRVGTTGDYPPFSYRNGEEDNLEGIDIQMMRGLADALGVKVVFVKTSWKELLVDLEANKFDIAAGGVSITPERAKHAFFSIPYINDGKMPVVRCADKEKFLTWSDIDQPAVHIIVNRGGSNEQFARQYFHQAQVRVEDNNLAVFNRIIAGEADVIVTDGIEGLWQHNIHPQLCVLYLSPILQKVDKAYMLPQDEVWRDYVDQWLTNALRTGQFEGFYKQWMH